MFVSPATDGQWEAGGKQSEEPAAGEQVGVDCLRLMKKLIIEFTTI